MKQRHKNNPTCGYSKAKSEGVSDFYLDKGIVRVFGFETIAGFMEEYERMRKVYRLAELIEFRFIDKVVRVKRRNKEMYRYKEDFGRFRVRVSFDEKYYEKIGVMCPALKREVRRFSNNPNLRYWYRVNPELCYKKDGCIRLY